MRKSTVSIFEAKKRSVHEKVIYVSYHNNTKKKEPTIYEYTVSLNDFPKSVLFFTFFGNNDGWSSLESLRFGILLCLFRSFLLWGEGLLVGPPGGFFVCHENSPVGELVKNFRRKQRYYTQKYDLSRITGIILLF